MNGTRVIFVGLIAILTFAIADANGGYRDSMLSREQYDKWVAKALYHIVPGTPRTGVIHFYGRPHLKGDDGSIWYKFSLDAVEKQGQPKQGYTVIFFDEDGRVVNIKTFEMRLVGQSEDFLGTSNGAGKARKDQ